MLRRLEGEPELMNIYFRLNQGTPMISVPELSRAEG